ncbi:MAG: efflux RND transporter permease subunit [Acidocella sp.]|nr:efflux RND transporter permease subunit [Acidocella sp.]
MRRFTDIFVERPVLASVISLLILVVGIRAGLGLSVLEYPKTTSADVRVTTVYYGADPDVVAGFITQPLEAAIAQANGIDYLTSQSTSGTSQIDAHLRLNYDSNKALNEINIKINSVINKLPRGSQQPLIELSNGFSTPPILFAFTSKVLHATQINDYMLRVVQPLIQAVPGVQTASILGEQDFALRAWLDPAKLAGFGVTATDVTNALGNNDFVSGLGNTRGQMVQVNLTASTDIHSVEQFRNLIVKQTGNAVVRLRDIATVELGAESYDERTLLNGRDGVFIGAEPVPGANLLRVVNDVRALLPQIKAGLPRGLDVAIAYDSSDFIRSSIHEVLVTLAEALGIVTLVVFLFLGSWRSVFIPVVAIPLSLIGTLALIAAFGFSINLLTLLAMVLAIGLVVDDAIIVVENVNRHLAEGRTPFVAAVRAARELAAPILAMTVVLIAVYVPVGLQSGLTGALFTEFAFTLVGAVTISAVIALTLSPMLCARMLVAYGPASSWQDRFADRIDRNFMRVQGLYRRMLASTLTTLPVVLMFAAIVLGSVVFLYRGSASELAPDEDQGFLFGFGQPAPNASLEQSEIWARIMHDVFAAVPEHDRIFQFVQAGEVDGGITLLPWGKRKRSAKTLVGLVEAKLQHDIPGMQMQLFSPPPLPGSSGVPINVVIKTTHPVAELNKVTDKLMVAARKTGKFIFLDTDLKIDLPQSQVVIDRDKAAALGLSMADIGSAMGNLLGGGYVNYFSMDGRSYQVIPQVVRDARLNPSQLLDYPVANLNGVSVPLAALAHITTRVIPESINRFQQENSATLQGAPTPGITSFEAVKTLQSLAATLLPSGYSLDYAGTSRQEVAESSGFVKTFGFALIIIFLALAALFESFRDPLIILVSVPMSLAGALIFINLGVGGATLNIYTEVGLVTLMGLISKHGILIVEVANEAQARGMSRLEAILHATSVRLRPILMTTAAMVLGVVPLLVASGAGAASRFNMGLVIASGLAIGTLFTLFVVPGVYMLLAADHQRMQKHAAARAATIDPAPG